MAFNGSGTYVRPSGQPVVAGTAISDSVFNTLTADLATALTTCVTRNGQSPATANLPMGTYKLTGLGNGSAATDSAAYGQIQSSANKIITVGGTADVITGSLSPTLLSYVTGDIYSFLVGSTNTTNVTINIDGLGARAITVNGATALVAGSLPSGKAVQIGYDGTQFQLLTDNYVGAASGTLPVVNGGTGVTTSTGSGAVVLGTSPTITSATLVTPALGTPASGTLTSCTGLPVAGGGTGLATLTANNLLVGAGTSTPTFIAPSTSGNMLVSNGTVWQSVADTSIGYGQTWQTVTRTSGTTYYNTTGKPITLNTQDTHGVGFTASTITVSGLLVSYANLSGNATESRVTLIGIGSSYVLSNASSLSVTNQELR